MSHNEVLVRMDSNSQNEAFARICAAAFVAPLNPTVSELSELKTAVSEAVTNAIIHGYPDCGNKAEAVPGKVIMNMSLDYGTVTICVRDEGIGISDVDQARTPLYSTKADEERSGMGFTVMEAFMDSVEVISAKGQGTEVVMRKRFSNGQDAATD